MPLFSNANAPHSLCIIRLSAIGDCVHVVAMVQAIQRQWPQTKLTWIMGKNEANLLGDLPNVEVLSFDKSMGIKAYISIWNQLHHRHFDALLHMQSAFRASLLTLGIKADKILGFDRQRASDGQSLFTNYKVPSPQSPHVLDGFMAFSAELGINDLTPKWNIPVSTTDNEWAKQQIDPKKLTLLISPAASKSYKNWTSDGYAALTDHAAKKGFKVILCGGPSAQEKQLAATITEKCLHKPTNLVGKTSLKRLFALIKISNLVLAPDTGPTHMATAAGVPVIGLYAHHNPARTGPYLYQKYVVSVYEKLILQYTGKLPSQLPWRQRLKDEHAMECITTQQVIEIFDRLYLDLFS